MTAPTIAEMRAAYETLMKLARSIEMGEVKDTVTKRTSTPKKPLDAGLLETAERMLDELSRCAAIKDEDALTEGDDLRAENMRKAAQLRSAHVLMGTVCRLLEDYA